MWRAGRNALGGGSLRSSLRYGANALNSQLHALRGIGAELLDAALRRLGLRGQAGAAADQRHRSKGGPIDRP
jgi:hypothetical protein